MSLFAACGCRTSHYMRAHRTWWMRVVFREHVLYHCRACEQRFLASPRTQEEIRERAVTERRRLPDPPTTRPGRLEVFLNEASKVRAE